MRHSFRIKVLMIQLICVVFLPSLLLAGTNIRESAPYAWGENIGWIDFRGNVSEGVYVAESYLSGYAWGENIGWLFLGNAPQNGTNYSQAEGDTGVNKDGAGVLSGYAWGENIGWIVFDTAESGQQVSIDGSGQFSGFAWSENLGWLNMNSGQGVSVDLRGQTLWLLY